MIRRSFAAFACVASLGCAMSNPAFDEARAAEGTDEADTKDPPGDGDGDPNTSSTTSTSDTSDDDDSETETGDTGPVEVCDFLVRPALRLALAVPPGDECPPPASKLFLSVALQTLNQPLGMATGNLCSDATCGSCTNLSYSVGAPEFAGLAEVWTALELLADSEGADGLCIEVAATGLIGLQEGVCAYRSLGIIDNTIEHGPVFVGNVNNAPMTWIAGLVLGQANPPSLSLAPLGSCSCATVHETLGQRECCESSGLEPEFHALSFLGVDVEPGMAKGISIQEVPWRFHAVSAQAVPGCENPEGAADVSWALTRVE